MGEVQPEMLWVPDICVFLNKDVQAVRHMIARRQIPTRRLGRRVYALRSELQAHLRGEQVITETQSQGAHTRAGRRKKEWVQREEVKGE